MGNMDIRIRIRWVGRKYREASRTVIITQTLLEPLRIRAPVKVAFKETHVSIASATEPDAASGYQSRIDLLARVTGHGPEFGSGDGMRSWMGTSDGMAARNVWRNVFQLRKSAVEDQLFEETRAR
jgi:hypothetical protein